MTSHGIHTIDTGFVRPGFDAAYVLVQNGHAAFIDSGTHYGVPRLLGALDVMGLNAAMVDWVILTHVHLDHAGGAGELMARLPNARLVVHPRGARHMADPSQLWAGATSVYGEEVMQQTFGPLRPVPEERIVAAADGHLVDLHGRHLRCLDTPGHAKHHMAIYDEQANVCFTGDTFGLSYRPFDTQQGPFILPTTTPVQLDPAALHASIDRLLALKPEAMYLTHFGRVEQVQQLAGKLHALIDAMVAIALKVKDTSDRHAKLVHELTKLYAARATEHGWQGDHQALVHWLGIDIKLNAQGLGVWLDRL